MKSCPKCGVTKDSDGFYVRPNGHLHSWCKDCMLELRRNSKKRQALQAKIKRKYLQNTMADHIHRKDYQLRYHYGIGIDEYKAMLEQQNYRCAICDRQHQAENAQGDSSRSLAVDHDHATGVVRALLCSECNRAIGYMQENPHLLRKAATYLDLYSTLIGRSIVEAEEAIAKSSSLDSS